MDQMLEFIEKFCKSKGIKYYNISSFSDNGNAFNFDNTKGQSLNEFLEFGVLINSKFLLIKTEAFNFEIEGSDEEFEKYDQEICCIDLYWINDGIVYNYEHVESWYEEYLNGENDSEGFVFDEDFNEDGLIKLTKTQIDYIIQSLINHEKYFIYNTRPNKLDALLDDIYLENEIDKANLWYINKQQIKNESQKIFNKNYLAIKEREYSYLIKKLKNEDKLSKKAIIAKLDITESVYEKCLNL